jgi:hypothetical protein
MAITITLNFTPAPPPSGKTFKVLQVKLTDAGGALQTKQFDAAQIQAVAVAQPDGSYALPVTFSGVAVGPYTVTAQSIDAMNAGYGPTATGGGTVALADGAWFPAPVAFV